MYETIKRLYLNGRLDATGVERAVQKNWITWVEADRILALDRMDLRKE